MTLAQLLVVQAHDTTIDQLAHRRATLPEHAAIAMIQDEREHLDKIRAEHDEQRRALQKQQTRIEDEVALIEDRYGKDSARLYSGTVTADKDLEAIQHELETLERRQRKLEDDVLDLMETIDPISTTIADIDAKLADVATRDEQVRASLIASEEQIDSQTASEQQQRSEAVSKIDAALVEHYEAARTQCGGVGVARLIDKSCEGCRLQLAAVKLDRIRKQPVEEVAWCDCGRILVRQ